MYPRHGGSPQGLMLPAGEVRVQRGMARLRLIKVISGSVGISRPNAPRRGVPGGV